VFDKLEVMEIGFNFKTLTTYDCNWNLNYLFLFTVKIIKV